MQSFAENAAIAGNSPAGGAEIKSQWQNKRIAFLGGLYNRQMPRWNNKELLAISGRNPRDKAGCLRHKRRQFLRNIKTSQKVEIRRSRKNRRNHDIRRDKRLQRQRSNRAMVQIRRSRSSNCKRQNANPQAQNPHNGFIYVQRPDKCGNGVHQRKFPRQTDYINYANTPRIRKVRRRKCSAGRIISQ